jgi:hypothetical protein
MPPIPRFLDMRVASLHDVVALSLWDQRRVDLAGALVLLQSAVAVLYAAATATGDASCGEVW